LEWAVQKRLIEHFVSGSTARPAASLVDVNKNTVALTRAISEAIARASEAVAQQAKFPCLGF
jgi:transposase-like protein